MRIAILGHTGSWYVEQLLQAGERRGHDCEAVDFERLASFVKDSTTEVTSDGVKLSGIDCVIVRTMPPGSLEQVVYRMDVLLQLQEAGVRIVNHPRGIECAVDKFLSTSRLSACGIPIPRTIVTETTDQAMEAFSVLGQDVVVKPLFGAEGRGIIRLSDPDLAFRSFRAIERLNSVIYQQEFILHEGFDVRILVLNGKVLGAIRRSHPTDFRTNVARQGKASLHRLTPEEEAIAVAAAGAVHTCFAGVDVLYDLSGRCYVIEVNAVPGWKAFQSTTKIDVAQALFEYLEE
ncbi:RimK family alpha-L-glutamate ligase [Thalassoglobus sp. JC818]|uniref:ATP-grasp domain-containing protein n=1 Tax=Thalassoglobus sp. JC818 TaxID=3232136 RepID=UPI00345AD9D9